VQWTDLTLPPLPLIPKLPPIPIPEILTPLFGSGSPATVPGHSSAGPAITPTPGVGSRVLTELPMFNKPVQIPSSGLPPSVQKPAVESPRADASPLGFQNSLRVGPNGLPTTPTGQLAIVALPGFSGLLFLTAGGGLIGYRQAKAGHWDRTRGVDRFLH
jgi:hypothetical protein